MNISSISWPSCLREVCEGDNVDLKFKVNAIRACNGKCILQKMFGCDIKHGEKFLTKRYMYLWEANGIFDETECSEMNS